jgi:DNA sulfur modification protein DndB
MKKRVQKEENNTKFGNAFHKKVEKLFMDLGMEIKYSSFTGEGPDIIASDPRTKTKFVIQCKATRKPKLYPGLKALINEYAERRRDARADISIIALSGYKISEKINLDEVSKKKKVRFITDETISEYIQLVSKINSFAIYQILADLGVAKKFDKESFFAPALHIKHPGHQFFVAAPTVEWLLKSASVYRRGGPSLHVKGYQRILNRDRVLRQIPEYLSQNEWVFPNAIICATQDNRSSKIKLSKKGEISLPSTTGLLWVIDGQHRLYSFANAPKELLKQKLLTVFFDSSLMKDKAESIQADIFIKLNKNAQRVKPTLVLELLKDLLTTKDIRLQVAFKLCDSSVLGDLVKTYTKKGFPL